MSSDAPERTAKVLIEEQAGANVRRVRVDGRWWFSVIAVIGFLTGAATPRVYWPQVAAWLQQRVAAAEKRRGL